MHKLGKRTRIKKPSFLEGVSRIADIGGTIQDRCTVVRRNEIKERVVRLVDSQTFPIDDADAQALASDWNAVANDLRTVTIRLVAKYHLPRSKASLLAHTSQLYR